MFKEKPIKEENGVTYFTIPASLRGEVTGWKKWENDGETVNWGDMNYNFGSVNVNVKGKLLLDIAVGSGWSSKKHVLNGANVWATEIRNEFESNGYHKVICDMNSLPFEDNLFDIVWINASLHHSTNILKALSEMKRVCKQGGLIVLTSEPIGRIYSPIADLFHPLNWKYGFNEKSPLMRSYTSKFNKLGLTIVRMGDYSQNAQIKKISRWTQFTGGVLNVVLKKT